MRLPSLSQVELVYWVILFAILTLSLVPRSWWYRDLRPKRAPSLRIATMARGEGWRAAAGYLAIAAISSGMAVGCVLFRKFWYGEGGTGDWLLALYVAALLGILLGLGGALYLGANAIFRPRKMYRWQEDELSRADVLKKFVSPDGSNRAVIVQHPGQVFEVIAVEPPQTDGRLGVTFRMFRDFSLRSLGKTPSLEDAEMMAREATQNQHSSN